MRWPLATSSLLIVTLLLAAAAWHFNWLPLHQPAFDPHFHGEVGEIGYYDLNTDHREHYSTFLSTRDNAVKIEFTSREDREFRAEITFIPQIASPVGYVYQYIPNVYKASQPHRLLQSNFSFMAHNGVTVNSLTFEGHRVVITPSGLIIRQ
ncbi:hypothetical protein LU196_07315 [Pantoea sp. Mb-10]|uniref:hypothetical protein n=1 Tax=unclassified Pantoea TaxID=2630326 RepID=UPI001E4F5781|nr:MULTISPECIES: hypothetical protein [unclassified Pantoea]MCE0489859.1 hypothetical protein [Pantoea sp. Mb-10]MCE0501035.1 hypothetical protein [Pantoea sp. Pb-8]